jgi:hypothetical protein
MCDSLVDTVTRTYGFGGETKERDHLEYLDVDGRVPLKWMWNK